MTGWDYISVSDQIRRQAPELSDCFAFWPLTPAQPLRGVFRENDPTDGLAAFQLCWVVCRTDVKAATAAFKCKFCLIISFRLVNWTFSQQAWLSVTDAVRDVCHTYRWAVGVYSLLCFWFSSIWISNVRWHLIRSFLRRCPESHQFASDVDHTVRSTNNILSCSRLHWPPLAFKHTNVLQNRSPLEVLLRKDEVVVMILRRNNNGWN